MGDSPFTQRRRTKVTRKSVLIADRISRGVITIGGISTVVAVVSVCAFLAWVVLPLFLPAAAEPLPNWGQASPASTRVMQVDPFRVLGWTLDDDGTLRIRRTADGSLLQARPLEQSGGATQVFAAADLAPDGRNLAVAYDPDGGAACRVSLLRPGFATRFLPFDDVPEDLRRMAPGSQARHLSGVLEITVTGQFRLQEFALTNDGNLTFPGVAEVLDVARASDGSREAVAVLGLDADGQPVAQVALGVREENLFTGAQTLSWADPVRLEGIPHPDPPAHILITDRTDNVTLLWPDGRAGRFTSQRGQSVGEPFGLVEALDLTEGDVQVTAADTLLGGNTMIVARSDGSVSGWFLRLLRDREMASGPDIPATDGPATGDDTALTEGHRIELPAGAGQATAISTSSRDRMFAVATDSGQVDVCFMTSERHLLRLDTGAGQPVSAVAFAPKDDGLYAATDGALHRFSFDMGHPAVSLQTAFGTVFYERGKGPEYKWQSAGGSDASEAKLSLIPLVFGTLKATFYSLLFAIPLALLAAIYTSEFMNTRTRARIKPALELMASLPSVVLGFLGGLVIAPFVEEVLGTVIAAMVVVPMTVLLSGYGWQMLPPTRQRLLARHRLWGVTTALVIGLGLSALLSTPIAAILFGGDVKAWLNHTDGMDGLQGTGWFLVLLPIAAVVWGGFIVRRVNPWLRRQTVGRSPRDVARTHLLRFLLGTLVVVVTAAVAAWLCGMALDLRAPDALRIGDGISLSPFSAYDQRNALVVGFVMGFAVIPVIYTIAEDALSSVPNHLRAASLGAGATPWQTAVRIIIPTAASGLFSAVMIGLGRAVGETMIVLMAAGNTPVLDMNIFSGFRTLAANIATEMPETVPGSTHYRLLFLTALTLFGMTFVINTLAEVVRLRFRRRAHQL